MNNQASATPSNSSSEKYAVTTGGVDANNRSHGLEDAIKDQAVTVIKMPHGSIKPER